MKKLPKVTHTIHSRVGYFVGVQGRFNIRNLILLFSILIYQRDKNHKVSLIIFSERVQIIQFQFLVEKTLSKLKFIKEFS